MKERSQCLNPLSFITFSQASEKNSYLKNIFIVIENIVFEFAKRQINQSTVGTEISNVPAQAFWVML